MKRVWIDPKLCEMGGVLCAVREIEVDPLKLGAEGCVNSEAKRRVVGNLTVELVNGLKA
jgi:hypothetical protein